MLRSFITASTLLLPLAGCGGSSGPSSGGHDAGSGGSGGTPHPGDCSLVADDAPPAPVPPGWVHAPCQPSSCDIYFAPDAEHMRPASNWTQCGDGCVALDEDWGDPSRRLLNPRGAARAGKRTLAYTRDLAAGDAGVGVGPFELQRVDLPSNTVTLDAMLVGSAEGCALTLRGLTDDAIAVDLATAGAVTPPSRTVLAGPASAVIPPVVWRTGDPRPVVESALSSKLWAASYLSGTSIEWQPLGGSKGVATAWTSPEGFPAADLFAQGDALFFGLGSGYAGSTVQVWTASAAATALISPADPKTGGVFGAITDGVDLVWVEGSGFDPSTKRYASVRLMTSPFATEPSAVKPRPARALADTALKGFQGTVGGGYVALLHPNVGDDPHVLSITRLADGAHWEIDPPGSAHAWGAPLYIDESELGVPLLLVGDLGVELGVPSDETFSVVRRDLTKLGAPTMP